MAVMQVVSSVSSVIQQLLPEPYCSPPAGNSASATSAENTAQPATPPLASTSRRTAAAAPTAVAATTTAPSATPETTEITTGAVRQQNWASRTKSAELQERLLHLLAAVALSESAVSALQVSAQPEGAPSWLDILVDFLNPVAPVLPKEPEEVVPAKGAKGKPDAKAKPAAAPAAGAKGKAMPAEDKPVEVGPSREHLPPFPVGVQLAATKCLLVCVNTCCCGNDTSLAVQHSACMLAIFNRSSQQ